MKIRITRKHIKILARVIIGGAVTAVVNQILRNNMNTPTGKLDKATQKVGSAVIGGMVADAAKDRSDELIDSVFEMTDKLKAEIEEIETEETPTP